MVADPTMRSYVARMMRDEIAPLLLPAPGIELGAYQSTVLERLGNERIGDPLSRLAGRGSTKMPCYLLPSLIEARREGQHAPLLPLAVAAWFRYLHGTDFSGHRIDIRDARLAELQPLARRGGTDPSLLLANRSVIGPLGDDVVLRRELAKAMRDLERLGVHGATKARLGQLSSIGKQVRPPRTLDVFNPEGVTVGDIAARTGLSRASVRRLLITLEMLGYASHAGPTYRLGSRALRLGFSFLSSTSLPALALPVLEEVTAIIRESSSLSALDGDEIVYLARSATRRVMSVGLSVGSRLPAYCTSMGRVLLAAMNTGVQASRVTPEEMVERFLPVLRKGAARLGLALV